MFKKFWLPLSFLLIFTGCTSVDINSNKDATYNKKLDRIVISDNLSSNPFFGERWEPVIQGLSHSLTNRGLSVQTIAPRREYQSEKGKDLKQAIASFMPNQVIELNPLKYQTGQNYNSYTLQVTIYDAMNMKAVWKSSVLLTQGGLSNIDPKKFANELIQKLEADGLLIPVSKGTN